MTFVGKILVIVIMAFSLIFLGISTVVFTTAKNWRTETEVQKKKASELTKKLNDAQAAVDASKKDLDAAKANYDALSKNLDNEVKGLQTQIATRQDQITKVSGEVAKAEKNAETALVEADARRKETLALREHKDAVEKQANEFKLRQADLTDKIRELERVLDTATKHNSDLRERVAKFSTKLRQAGLSDDISQIKGMESPPPVVGEVKRGGSHQPAGRTLDRVGRRASRRPRVVPSPGEAPTRIPGQDHNYFRRSRPGRRPCQRNHVPGQKDKGGRPCLVYDQAADLARPPRQPVPRRRPLAGPVFLFRLPRATFSWQCSAWLWVPS